MKLIIAIVFVLMSISASYAQRVIPQDSLTGYWYCPETDEHLIFVSGKMISDGLHLGYTRSYHWKNDSTVNIGGFTFQYDKLNGTARSLTLIDSTDYVMHLLKISHPSGKL